MNTDEKFKRDILPEDHDSVMTMLCEAAQGINDYKEVTILETDRLDAINVRAHGILEWRGREYVFIIEDGNWNGTTIESWDEDKEFNPLPRTQWALQPIPRLVGDAILANRGPFLILKWDAMLQRDQISSIPGKYSYDRYVQPGSYVENYWKKKAAEHHFEIVPQEVADETRKRLKEAS